MHTLPLLLQRLADAGLEFVIVGDFAGAFHGAAPMTLGLEVCAVLSLENVDKIRNSLVDLNPVHRRAQGNLSFLEHPTPGQPLLDLHLQTDAGIVDILSSILGVGDFHRLRKEATAVSLFGRTFSLISIEDLIAAKQAVGREKDLLAVKELRAIAAKRQLSRDTPGTPDTPSAPDA